MTGAFNSLMRTQGFWDKATRIQWSLKLRPRPTSRLGMWQAMQPDLGETRQTGCGRSRWQERQVSSYMAVWCETRE